MTDNNAITRGNNAAGMLDNLIHTLIYIAKTLKLTFGENDSSDVPAP